MKIRHITLLLTVALFLGVATAAVAAAENRVVPVSIAPNAPEAEPNDDFASATWVDWGTWWWHENLTARMTGKLDPAADVDTYVFQPAYLDTLVVDWSQWRASPASTLSLYDRSGNLLAESTCPTEGICLQYVMTQADVSRPDYYLKVANADPGSSIVTHYEMTMNYAGKTDPYEPNDSIAEAVPIDYGGYGLGVIEPCDDVDYFSFEGRAGDQLRIEHQYGNASVKVLDANQNVIIDDAWEFVLPADGIYYLAVNGGECGHVYLFRFNYLDQPLYLSFDKGGQIQGIQFTSGDVLRYWTRSGRWEMFLDLSDVGLTGNLTSLGVGDNWYLSFVLGFKSSYALQGAGTITPQDLVFFDVTSTGEDTDGRLSAHFDGSDVGLTTTGEAIDSLTGPCLDCTWIPMTLGTSGHGRVPYGMGALLLEDEDLVSFTWTSAWGADTSGTWAVRFDGSRHGLGAADVIGLGESSYYDSETGDEGEILYLSFDRQVRFGGIDLAPGDIAACPDSRYDSDDLCDSFTKFFDASDAGLSGVMIDAFEIGRLD